jgi:hypothetical protein
MYYLNEDSEFYRKMVSEFYDSAYWVFGEWLKDRHPSLVATYDENNRLKSFVFESENHYLVYALKEA